jgi:carbon monoxide dehydrogenase subunit G
MLDLARIAPCLPGASIDEQDRGEYEGKMRVNIGPITAKYQGTVKYEEIDEQAYSRGLREKLPKHRPLQPT